MAERRSVRKWCWEWEFEKMERWLNDMAMSGWGLVEVGVWGWGPYTFERCEPGEYIYRMEMRENDPEYLAMMEDSGAVCLARRQGWYYFRKRAEEGSFELYSDLDSRIAHLDRIARLLLGVGLLNLGIGIVNTFTTSHGQMGIINLLCCALCMYGLGRIRGKQDQLKEERELRE